MKYMILIINTEASRRLTATEREAWMSEVMAWYDKWGGQGKVIDSGNQLDGAEKAKTVRASGVTDGPFMETKEVLGGYSVLQTDTIDEAVDIAETWPGVDRGWITVEVRPVVQH